MITTATLPMFFETTYNQGLGAGGNELSPDPAIRDYAARAAGAALSTVTPSGVYVPMPFKLPDGSIAIGVRAIVGPGAGLAPGQRFDPNTAVQILLQKTSSGYVPGPAYSWPVVASRETFIRRGYAAGFPVRDFYCDFYPEICDWLTRAALNLPDNPCYGKAGCNPRDYLITTGTMPTAAQQPAAAAQASSPSSGTPAITLPGRGTVRTLPAPVEQPHQVPPTASSAATPVSPGSDVLSQASSALGLPSQIDIFGYKLNPVAAGLGAIAAWYLFFRK